MSDRLLKESDVLRIAFQLPLVVNSTFADAVKALPSADKPQGEWEEKETFHNADDDPIIEEWQSARCSVCHKYHTTPYKYYFNNYNFCPNCGADMRGENNE